MFCIVALLAAALNASDLTTPLHDAVYNEDVASVRRLLQSGTSPGTTNRYGVSPISLAATNGNFEILSLLLNAGADANTVLPGGETVLMTASRTGRPDSVKVLLAKGANVHSKETAYNQTALMWAAAEGHVETIQALLKAGAEINARSKSGFTPLLFAVREGRIPAVQTLLKLGASPNEAIESEVRRGGGVKGPPAGGAAALLLAVENGHFQLASVLLDAGADPNASQTGLTALHAITGVRKPGLGDNDPAPDGSGNMSSLDLVGKLVAKGADINARMTKKIGVGLTSLNTLGATPFLLAARSADSELMRFLASLGADVRIPNADNANAVIVAAGLGTRSPGEDAGTEEEVVVALQAAIDLGVDINAVDNNGETAMHGAAYKNLPAAVLFLAEKGAKIEIWNRKNKYGWTPLTIAEGYRFGNYKPSPTTIAAFHKIMLAAGVSIASDPTAKGR